MPSDLFLKTMNTVHKTIMAFSFGTLGWQIGPMKVVELTTTGRKSRQKRTVMLTSPVQEGDAVVIVASRGGDDTHPAWFLNLRDDPNVEVRMNGKPPVPMRARIANDEERERLWPQAVKAYKGYGDYQKKTDRTIPLVFLEPVAHS